MTKKSTKDAKIEGERTPWGLERLKKSVHLLDFVLILLLGDSPACRTVIMRRGGQLVPNSNNKC